MKCFICRSPLGQPSDGKPWIEPSGEPAARPSRVAVSDDAEAAVHDRRVRVAAEPVAALLQGEHDAPRTDVVDAGENAIDVGPAQMEVVDVRAVAYDEAIRLAGLQRGDFLALHAQADREARAN